MTDEAKQKLRTQRMLDVSANQRNQAMNDVVSLAAEIAVLEAENAELKAEIEALKAVPKKKGAQA